ncbi:ABC transporter substrate-binding protein [Nonomuraea sp. ATR24]|uniref:ABC transporter substrate-binding protein n=1 Tax=Nonomuraea TaxID=83681 RepID=UPI001C5DDE1C|nr:ABC transporter substrate-binding protein [Nonomuraea ceibae]
MRLARTCALGLALVLGVAACGDDGPAPATGGSGLEKTQLTVGIVPVPSSAPLFIAEKRGFFKEEGLTVKTEVIQAPQAVMPKILNGSMDAFLTSYVSLLAINDSGAAKLKLLQHSQEAAPGVAGVVVPKGSPIKTAADLKGRTVAVNVLKALGQTLTNAHVQEAGLKPEDVKFVAVPFADQLNALSGGQVDAAWLVEPFLTAAKTKMGATEVIDTTDGVTAGIPIDGWGVSEAWLAQNPKTAAAFHRALAKAQKIASEDRAAINEVIPTYTQIDAQAAAAMKLGVFSMEVDKASLQKLADLLAGYGYLKTKPDVTQQIAAVGG